MKAKAKNHLRMYKYIFGIICLGSICVLLRNKLLIRIKFDMSDNASKTTSITKSENVLFSEIINSDASINRTKITKPPAGTQMGQAQIDKVLSVLPKNTNLLVWGLGNDSPFWHDSTDGKVIFLEEHGTSWFKIITDKYPFLEAYQVKYSTHLTQSFSRYDNRRDLWHELDVRSQLPPSLVETLWDVILVDAPAGYDAGPGRYQAIYTSLLLSKLGTHIFVDDYERKVEHQMCYQMLGMPIEVTRRPRSFVNANQQAHFIINEWHMQDVEALKRNMTLV